MYFSISQKTQKNNRVACSTVFFSNTRFATTTTTIYIQGHLEPIFRGEGVL